MLRTAVALAMAAASVANAANTETRAELSQARARIVLDHAVEANGGVEALRAIEVVRLRLEGQTFPRLQMTTLTRGGGVGRAGAARQPSSWPTRASPPKPASIPSCSAWRAMASPSWSVMRARSWDAVMRPPTNGQSTSPRGAPCRRTSTRARRRRPRPSRA